MLSILAELSRTNELLSDIANDFAYRYDARAKSAIRATHAQQGVSMDNEQTYNEVNGVQVSQPRAALSVVANQKRWQWTNNSDFYKMLPAPYCSFYNNWVRLWLYWYDGYVPWVHGTPSRLTVDVNRHDDCKSCGR